MRGIGLTGQIGRIVHLTVLTGHAPRQPSEVSR